MEWINVEDKLPEEGQRVLCYPNGINILTFGVNEEGDWRKGLFCDITFSEYWDDTVPVSLDVTHWMKLPNPPKQ